MDIIKIAIYGQIDNDTKFGYTYPEKFDPTRHSQEDEWLRSVVDPRETRVFRSDRVYTLWKNHLGNYYAVTVPNRNDSRNGLLSVVMFTGKFIIGSGQCVVQALRRLEDILVNRQQTDNQMVEQVVAGVSKYLVPDFMPENNTILKDRRAYRKCHSEAELAKLFQYPNQKEYREYKRIFIIDANTMYAGGDYGEITKPVVESFIIRNPYPNEIRTTSTFVENGGKIELVYLKNGYEPCKKVVTVAPGTNDVQLEAVFCRLKSAAELGIRFSKKINIRFLSPNNTPVHNVRVKAGNISAVTNENGVCQVSVPETAEQGLQLSAQHPSYDNFSAVLNGVENGKNYDYKLKAKNYRLTLNIGGKVLPTEVPVPMNSPLFKMLKDDYNATISPGQIMLRVNKPSARLYGAEDEENSWLKRILPIAKYAGIALFAFYLLYGGISLIKGSRPWPFAKKQEVAVVDDAGLEENDSKSAYDQAEIAYQNDDLIYMKKEDVWEKGENGIKSEKFRNLYECFTTGDINGIIDQDWFKDGEPVNGRFAKIQEALRLIAANPKLRDEAFKEIRRIVSQDEGIINLSEIQSALDILAKPQQVNPQQPVQDRPKPPAVQPDPRREQRQQELRQREIEQQRREIEKRNQDLKNNKPKKDEKLLPPPQEQMQHQQPTKQQEQHQQPTKQQEQNQQPTKQQEQNQQPTKQQEQHQQPTKQLEQHQQPTKQQEQHQQPTKQQEQTPTPTNN